jgi:diguanylate cyclase (GGDEF)-like protein/PAS domain S-box-containing protein
MGTGHTDVNDSGHRERRIVPQAGAGLSEDRLVRLRPFLGEVVDAAIAISGADFGSIQLIDPNTSHLKIVASRGFPQWWLDFWDTVTAGRGVCGTALEHGKRVVVEDVEQSPIFAGTSALEVQLKAGVRAVQSTPIVTREGKPIGMFSTHYKTPHQWDDRTLQLLDLLARQAADIIARAQCEEAARQAADFNEAVLSSLGEGVYTVGEDGLVTSINPAAAELLGWTAAELGGKRMHDIVHHHHRDGRSFPFAECPEFEVLTNGRALRNREDVFIRKDGSFFDVAYTISPMHVGRNEGLVVSFSDITERKRAEETARLYEKAKELAQLAHHDALTGLPNRVLFNDRLEQALEQARRHGKRAAMLILDLDRFKLVNGTLGHAAGDRLLESVAQRCKHCVRGEDTVSRLGGDEFGFVLHEIVAAQDAAVVAEKILQQISAPIALEGREMVISGSIGISVYPDDGQSGGDLVKAADAAMYRAKRKRHRRSSSIRQS